MTARRFTFRVLGGRFAVVRLSPDTPVPAWATAGQFFSITRTDDELSIVCEQALAPDDVTRSDDWAALKLVGPFAFDETGVVASVTRTLADAGVGVFVLSTYDGDHVLVPSAGLPAALKALAEAGHLILAPDHP